MRTKPESSRKVKFPDKQMNESIDESYKNQLKKEISDIKIELYHMEKLHHYTRMFSPKRANTIELKNSILATINKTRNQLKEAVSKMEAEK